MRGRLGQPLVQVPPVLFALVEYLLPVRIQAPIDGQAAQLSPRAESPFQRLLLLRVRRPPLEALLRQAAHVQGVDAPPAEGLDDRQAVAPAIIRDQVDVGGDQGPQVVAEGDVDRRAVVESPDAHSQDVVGGLGGLLRQPSDQIRVDLPRSEHAAPPGGDAQQIDDARLVDAQEGIEHRGDQDRPAGVGFTGAVDLLRVGLLRPPFPGRSVDLAQGIPQRAPPPDRLAELLGELGEQVLFRQIAAGLGDLVAQHLGVGEVLEERHDVGEGLVEGQDVDVARLDEAPVHAVQQGVGRLVGDDVMGEAGEDRAAGEDALGAGRRGGKVAEQERLLDGAVVGVGLAQRMGVDAQAAHELVAVPACPPVGRHRPERTPAEGLLEVADGRHRDRIDHLLVKLGVALRRRQPILRQQMGIVEVHRRVAGAVGVIHVDHLEVFPDRPGREIRLPRDLERDLVDERRLELGAEARIEGEGAQAPERWTGQAARAG